MVSTRRSANSQKESTNKADGAPAMPEPGPAEPPQAALDSGDVTGTIEAPETGPRVGTDHNMADEPQDGVTSSDGEDAVAGEAGAPEAAPGSKEAPSAARDAPSPAPALQTQPPAVPETGTPSQGAAAAGPSTLKAAPAAAPASTAKAARAAQAPVSSAGGAGAPAAGGAKAQKAAAGAGPRSAPASDSAPPESPAPLDAFRKIPKLRRALDTLQARVDDSAVFLRPSAEVATAARQAAKLLYQQFSRLLLAGGGASTRAERRALRRSAAAPLPELHTDASFDPEQIWLQMELATEATVRRVRRLIRTAEPLASGGNPGSGAGGLVTAEAAQGIERLLRGGDSEDSDESMGTDDEEDGSEDGGAPGASDASDDADGEEGPSDSEDEGQSDDDDEEDEDGFLDDEEEEEDEEGGAGRRRAKKARTDTPRKGGAKAGPGGVEDRFFRLSDLERYVEDAERRQQRGDDDEDEDDDQEGEEGEDEDEDDAAGLFGGDDDDDEAMEALLRQSEAAAGKKKGKGDGGVAGLRYQDFFGAGDQDEEEEGEGEDEDEDEEGAPGRGLLSSDDDEEMAALDEDAQDEQDGEGAAARRRSGKAAGPRGGDDEAPPAGRAKSKAGGKASDGSVMSTHERRLARMQERVAEIEAEALAERSWHLTGEATAGSRPLNSALELDMDFETTAKPTPVQTDEMTNDIEAMIKKRIADRRFDDVIRIVPAPVETKKKEIELDDTKAKAGLGELYEQDYVRQVTGGTAEDKDEKLRQEAQALFKALCFKLDALCRFHFAPKPVVQDMTIRSDVPAIVMEEAAPVAVSKAAMQMPGEVYNPATKDGRPVAEGELTKEERKQRRAKKKRVRKVKEEAKEADRRARAIAAGGTAEIVGRKSDSKVVAGKGVKVAEGAGAARHGRTDLGNSSAVFAKLAAEQAAAAAGGGAGAAGKKVSRDLKKAAGQQEGGKKAAAALKL